MSLTKHDLVLRVSEKTGFQQQMVQKVLELSLEAIAASLAEGIKVELRNFGVFDIRVRDPRVGRNPRSPTKTVTIPKRAVVKFRAGKQMRLGVLGLLSKPSSLKQPPPA
ncbi:Integration host factor subunit beta [Verrucomicrobia bacterium]|nr:Integration host factor subunit beta [Verrucomicrobiota bacterium]